MPERAKVHPEILQKARDMRRHPTAAEALLWQALRRRQVAGARFRRQHPVGRFILDFYCVEKRIAIEIDGPHHDGDHEWDYDQARERYLATCEMKVLRFADSDVRSNLRGVVESIAEACRVVPSRGLPRRAAPRSQRCVRAGAPRDE